MSNSFLLLLCSIALVILGIVMVGLGLNAGILPPTITGIGFFVIALALRIAGKK